MNILLLRGLARESRQWGDFPSRLEKRMAGTKVHVIDLPGAGTECARTSPASVPAIMEDVRGRWRNLRDANPGPWLLFGISFGGMIAMSWARTYPADHCRVVIANSSAANVGHPLKRLRPAAVKTVLKTIRMQDALTRERTILNIISNAPEKREGTAAEWATYAHDRPMRRTLVARQILAASRFRVPDGLPIPALVLASSADRLVDATCSERIAERLGAKIERHPTAGHSIVLDDPDWVVDRIATWIASS